MSKIWIFDELVGRNDAVPQQLLHLNQLVLEAALLCVLVALETGPPWLISSM